MVYCSFCSTFMGLLSTESFCTPCNFLRRLYLLHEPGDQRNLFLSKVKTIFLTPLDHPEPSPSRQDDDDPCPPNFIDRRRG